MPAEMTFGEAAEFFRSLAGRAEAARREGLEVGIKVALEESKSELGRYQPAAPPFGEWKPLAEATRDERRDLGFPEDEPLLRTGELRAAIESNVEGDTAAIGVPSREVGDGSRKNPFRDIGLVAQNQELGVTIPARSFLGGAMVRKHDEILEATARPTIELLRGERE